MELNKKNILKILGIIAFTVVLCAVLMKFSTVIKVIKFIFGVCLPFIIGAGLAFILNIPMSFYERKIFGRVKKRRDSKKSTRFLRVIARPSSLIITILSVLVVIAVVIGILVPQLGKTLVSVKDAMVAFWPKAESWAMETFANNEELISYIESLEVNWGNIINNVKDFALAGAGSVLNITMNVTTKVVNFFYVVLIAFVFSIYVLLQKEKLAIQSTKLIKAIFKEKTVDKILSIASLSHKTFSKFFTGQCLEALILGAMFVLVMTIFGMPYALLVGVVIAVTALIPIVGAFVGCAIGAFLILLVNPMQALVFIIIFLILQQIEGNLIYPYVVGNSVGLPSMWVLFAVTVGGSLMGVVGMLIFIPLMSVLYSLLRDWVNDRIRKKTAKN